MDDQKKGLGLKRASEEKKNTGCKSQKVSDETGGQLLVRSLKPLPKLTIEQSVKRLFNQSELSDVCFLVGEQRERIYAQKIFLAVESEVFKSMFYGDLKEANYEIEVPDLSSVGFRNMIQ